MGYRNGTYVAFHADGTREPTESDIKYYNLLKAWHVRGDSDFAFVDSHEKTGALRESSRRATVESALRERLRNSKNMILIIGKTTHKDRDWVPMEISYAVDVCEIPIIAAYAGYQRIDAPLLLRSLWPAALAARVDNGSAHVIHIPFSREPLTAAVQQFHLKNYPIGGGIGVYSNEAYRSWHLL